MGDTLKLDRAIDSLDQWAIPAGQIIVYRDHQPIYRRMAGVSDYAGLTPLKGNELYHFYSATKMFTCCAALQLIEQGRMQLADPVSKYLPAFGNLTVKADGQIRPAANVLTIRHLFGMQSGMNYDLDAPAIRDCLAKYGAQTTTRQLVDAMASTPLDFEPGTDYQYSLSHDVLAAVVEVVSGEKFSDYLNRHIFMPCGIHDFSFTLPADRAARMCAQYTHQDTDNGPFAEDIGLGNRYMLSDCYESGGAGLNGPAEEYVLFLDALACGGITRSGESILKPETIKMWSTVKSDGKPRDTFYFWRGELGYNYGLGVRVMEHCNGAKALSPDGEFGWDGAAGAYVLVDIEHRLSLYFSMHVKNYNDVYFKLHPMLRDLVYECLL